MIFVFAPSFGKQFQVLASHATKPAAGRFVSPKITEIKMTAEDDLGDILEEIDRNLNGDKDKQGMMIKGLWTGHLTQLL